MKGERTNRMERMEEAAAAFFFPLLHIEYSIVAAVFAWVVVGISSSGGGGGVFVAVNG